MYLMRRFLIALTGTIAGLAALLSFKSMSSTAGTTSASAAGTTSTATSPATTKTGSTGTTGKVFKGAVEESPYGPTQVEATLDGKKIVDVTVLQHTDDGTMSQQIDSNALPQLAKGSPQRPERQNRRGDRCQLHQRRLHQVPAVRPRRGLEAKGTGDTPAPFYGPRCITGALPG
jgi:hypothetical protein